MQGKTISGYTLQRHLGTGGMAEVWYAENKIGKKAAVKLLLPKLCDDENVKSRFLTEAKVMVELNHPNIRQVYDYGDIDGRPAIVMEYLDGEDLKTKLKRGQRFKEAELERWWNQLVLALNYTHQKGIVHRDIKPGNIFVDREGNIKLLDFGIAKVRESISSTQTGQKLGTLMYMSPEQVRDSKHIDYRTDIYSLAVTFVHLITGKRPYDSETSSDFEISEQIVYKPLDLRGVPMAWRNFLSPYLEKAAQNRPALRPFEMVTELPVDDANDEMEDTIGASPGSGTEGSGISIPSSKGAGGPTPPSKGGGGIKKDSPTPTDKPKSKKGLWIGLGAAAVAVIALVIILVKPKTDSDDCVTTATEEQIFQQCQTVGDYRVFMDIYGPDATHYAEAKAFVDQYMADSTAKAQQLAAQLQAQQQDQQTSSSSSSLTITANGVSFVMKPVAGGTFQMGSNDSEADSDEKPVHSVTISSFYMGETEVTQALWKAVMGEEPTYNGGWTEEYGRGSNYPTYRVSWNDIQSFIRKLNSITGRNFRLPTEAEWEFAARGGNKSNGYKYAGSSNIGSVAWYDYNSGSKTHAVKGKSPNELDLYDMSGNVWEWCQDWYWDYSSSSQTNPKGSSNGSARVLRGGSWCSGARYCRVSNRFSSDPDNRYNDLGFRLCLPQ